MIHGHGPEQASHIQQKTKLGMQGLVSVLMTEIVRSHQYFFGLNVADLKEILR